MSGEAADRYRRVAAGLGACVDAVPPGAWDRPAPCEGWVARDVVGHLVEWVPGFFAHFAGLPADPLPPAADDPAAAWRALDDRLRGWLADPSLASIAIDGPMGRTDLAGAIDQYVTPDVLIHTWDLARATGLPDRLDPGEVARMQQGMEAAGEPLDRALRSSGHYGPQVPVAEGASTQDRLLAFLGRDPEWTPPT